MNSIATNVEISKELEPILILGNIFDQKVKYGLVRILKMEMGQT
jgi:hypothetical protein